MNVHLRRISLMIVVPVKFSHLCECESVAWTLYLKLKDMFLKDVRPTPNLAVKEYELVVKKYLEEIAIHFSFF